VPNRHGLTLGELALLMNKGFGRGEDAIPALNCDLEVIGVKGWKRRLYFDETSLTWVSPSPNMPTLDTALVYPGACLFEGTTVSEGRGTTRPFEQFGAPYIDGFLWAEAVQQEGISLAGAALRPTSFLPQFHKYGGQVCHGLQVHVVDRSKFEPYRLCLALISSLAKLYPKDFSWRHETYEFVADLPAVDLLFGSSLFRETVNGGVDLSFVIKEMEEFERGFSKAREEFLLY
jgi:uncharacterized protein YbbC (DUF1343 family)